MKHENQVILLMITDFGIIWHYISVNKWHYIPVKKLSALFKGIKSKHDGDFYC